MSFDNVDPRYAKAIGKLKDCRSGGTSSIKPTRSMAVMDEKNYLRVLRALGMPTTPFQLKPKNYPVKIDDDYKDIWFWNTEDSAVFQSEDGHDSILVNYLVGSEWAVKTHRYDGSFIIVEKVIVAKTFPPYKLFNLLVPYSMRWKVIRDRQLIVDEVIDLLEGTEVHKYLKDTFL